MTVNMKLAEERCLDNDVIGQINDLHNRLYTLMKAGIYRKGYYTEEYIEEQIKAIDYVLQYLWGYPFDESRHTYLKSYRFKKAWVGRVFKCVETDEVMVVPFTVEERDYYTVGQGSLDVGTEFYSRRCGVVEVTDEQGEH